MLRLVFQGIERICVKVSTSKKLGEERKETRDQRGRGYYILLRGADSWSVRTTSTRYRDLIDTQSLSSFITAPGTARAWLSGVVCLGLEQFMFGTPRFRHRTACCVLRAASPAKSETIKYQLFWRVSERIQGGYILTGRRLCVPTDRSPHRPKCDGCTLPPPPI